MQRTFDPAELWKQGWVCWGLAPASVAMFGFRRRGTGPRGRELSRRGHAPPSGGRDGPRRTGRSHLCPPEAGRQEQQGLCCPQGPGAAVQGLPSPLPAGLTGRPPQSPRLRPSQVGGWQGMGGGRFHPPPHNPHVSSLPTFWKDSLPLNAPLTPTLVLTLEARESERATPGPAAPHAPLGSPRGTPGGGGTDGGWASTRPSPGPWNGRGCRVGGLSVPTDEVNVPGSLCPGSRSEGRRASRSGSPQPFVYLEPVAHRAPLVWGRAGPGSGQRPPPCRAGRR